jgi:hypothetical protein
MNDPDYGFDNFEVFYLLQYGPELLLLEPLQSVQFCGTINKENQIFVYGCQVESLRNGR